MGAKHLLMCNKNLCLEPIPNLEEEAYGLYLICLSKKTCLKYVDWLSDDQFIYDPKKRSVKAML